MAISPATIAERLSNMFLGNSSEGPKGTGGAYDPSPIDIFVVRTILCRSKRLPPDIVDVIFDHAGYWAHSTNQIDYMEEHKNPLRITGTGKKENKFLVRSESSGDGLVNNQLTDYSYAPSPLASQPLMIGRIWPRS